MTDTSIFCTERDGKYIHFRPIPIISYLKEKEIIGEYYEGKARKPHPM